MTPKGYGVIRGHRDLGYDPKGHGQLYGRVDPVYDPKRSWGHKMSTWLTLWPLKVNLTFDLDLDPKVKHLTWQVTTDVQVTL